MIVSFCTTSLFCHCNTDDSLCTDRNSYGRIQTYFPVTFFVDKTLIIKEISREDLRLWYNGYCTVKGTKLYNPRSVVCALADNQISNYRTSSGPYDEICQIYSAMVVYGLLTYDSDAREVFIPNRELMDQFDALLLNNPNPGYANFIFSPEQPSRSSSYRIFSIPIF